MEKKRPGFRERVHTAGPRKVGGVRVRLMAFAGAREEGTRRQNRAETVSAFSFSTAMKC